MRHKLESLPSPSSEGASDGAIDYDALLEERGETLDELSRRQGAERLAEAARNLASLTALQDAEASARERPAAPQTFTASAPAEGAPQGDRE